MDTADQGYDDLVDYGEDDLVPPEQASSAEDGVCATIDATASVAVVAPTVTAMVTTDAAGLSDPADGTLVSRYGEAGGPRTDVMAPSAVELVAATNSSDARAVRCAGFQSASRSNSPGTPIKKRPVRSPASPEASLIASLAPAELAISNQVSANDCDDEPMAGTAPATGTGDGDVDREEQVRIGLRWFLGPAAYDEVDFHAGDSAVLHVMARAPWFDKEAVLHVRDRLAEARGDDGEGEVPPGTDLFEQFLNARGCLPGDFPRAALDTWVWRQMFCVRDADLRGESGMSPTKMREAFVSLALKGLRRFLTRDLMEEQVSDLFVYRTRGEMSYVEALDAVTEEQLAVWVDGTYGDDAALLLTRPLLSRKFRYETKNCPFLLEQVAEEKSYCTYFNLCIPYFAPQCVYMNRAARRHAFPTPTAFWNSIQLPEGALVEMPGVMAHLPSKLRRRESGWWVVAYTEYAARAAAWLLSEVYDSLLLWYVPPALIELMTSLDLSFVLGNQQNVEELRGLLRVVSQTDFSLHSPAQRLRMSHGRASTSAAADYLYYDPWRGQVLTYEQYIAMRTRGRVQMPAGHPSGFNWAEEVEGWDGRRYVRPADVEVGGEVAPTVRYFGAEYVRHAPGRLFQKNKDDTRYFQGAYFGCSDVDTSLPNSEAVALVPEDGVEPQATAGSPADADMRSRSEGSGSVGEGAAAGAPASAPAATAYVPGRLSEEQRTEAVRDFLRQVGYREEVLTSLSDMVMYTRGRSGI